MFKRLYSTGSNGPTGKVDVPAVGLLIGELASWDLTRREGEVPNAGLYDLRASFLHVSEWLFNDHTLAKRIIIEIGRGKQYRLEAADDARTVLDGQSLLIEGVKLCPLE